MQTEDAERSILSHLHHPKSLAQNINELSEKIEQRGDLLYTTVAEQIKILNELATFPVGQYLIKNRGLNGYWTDVLLTYPEEGRQTGRNPEGKPLGNLEQFLFNEAPTVLATQERYQIFKQEIQKRLHSQMRCASVPCGLMGDLLTLDYSSISEVTLYGVDIDQDSLQRAEERAKQLPSGIAAHFLSGDAWRLSLPEPVQLLTSNGLNIYEQDDTRVVELYRQFYQNIAPGGVLIISFLTPPPSPTTSSEWKAGACTAEQGRLQRIIFSDVLGASWQAFRTTETTIAQLKDTGFDTVEVLPGRSGIFPTAIAHRTAK